MVSVDEESVARLVQDAAPRVLLLSQQARTIAEVRGRASLQVIGQSLVTKLGHKPILSPQWPALLTVSSEHPDHYLMIGDDERGRDEPLHVTV